MKLRKALILALEKQRPIAGDVKSANIYLEHLTS
jgi:hypothetical protein